MSDESTPTAPARSSRDAQPELGGRLLDLVRVMDTLRVKCPWDAEQTHETLAKYLVEEAYEAVEAIEHGDPGTLREELGDVLLQVVFHARVAEERGDDGFTIDDVAGAIVEKLVRRHPHVFAETEVEGVDDVRANWETIKAAERTAKGEEDASVVAGVPFGQPAALLAYELQKRAARNGIPEDLIAAGDDTGATLFDAVAVERRAGSDPEMDLRSAARGFDARVRTAEARARADGHDPRSLTPDQWREYWTEQG